MNQRAGWMCSVMTSGALLWSIAVTGGCTSQEFEQTAPDGTALRFKRVEFAPDVELRPGAFTVHRDLTTPDGFPMEVLTPTKPGGPTYYRVYPPGLAPLLFQQVPVTKPSDAPIARPDVPDSKQGTTADAPARTTSSMRGFDAYRADVDLLADTAELRVRTGDGPWERLAHGSVDEVLRAALENGIHPIEFDNEFGHWRITPDQRLPFVSTRLDGTLVNVHGMQ